LKKNTHNIFYSTFFNSKKAGNLEKDSEDETRWKGTILNESKIIKLIKTIFSTNINYNFFLLIQNHENLQQLRNEKLNSIIIQKIKERVGKRNQLAILKSLKFATAGKFSHKSDKKQKKNERIILLEFFFFNFKNARYEF
jgi:hypothetical protein